MSRTLRRSGVHRWTGRVHVALVVARASALGDAIDPDAAFDRAQGAEPGVPPHDRPTVERNPGLGTPRRPWARSARGPTAVRAVSVVPSPARADPGAAPW